MEGGWVGLVDEVDEEGWYMGSWKVRAGEIMQVSPVLCCKGTTIVYYAGI